jgi:TrpR-related protein YerC/YecD
MKKRIYQVKSDDRRKMLREFCGIISRLKNEKEAEKFLRDLLTPGEIVMITHRIEIAKMLLLGFSYRDIAKKLKVGISTISNVNRWLFSGFGGYLNEFKKAKNQAQRKKIIPTNEWEALKRKYPMHFLIFNLLDDYKNRRK